MVLNTRTLCFPTLIGTKKAPLIEWILERMETLLRWA